MQHPVVADDRSDVRPAPGVDEVRQVLDVVAQALTIIAPLAARLREKLQHEDDAVAFEAAVCRAVESIRTLQPGRPKGHLLSD